MDIDIDVPTTFDVKAVFPSAVVASMVSKSNTLTKHPCGAYFENMPVDCITGYAAIPYADAELCGYTKVDFLHLSILNDFRCKADVRALLNRPTDWSLLLVPEIVCTLFQLKNSWEYVSAIKPSSIEELADVVAIIRPTKRHLLSRYVKSPSSIRPLLYKQDEKDKTSFRRSHAIAYAHVIVLQLNAISTTSTSAVEL